MSDFNFPVLTDLIRAALVCVSKDETRYYLKGVAIQRDGAQINIVATDGHRLFCGRYEPEHAAYHMLPGEDLIIPADVVKKALTGYKAATIQLARNGDMWTLGDVTFRPIDGVFPEWRRVFPDQKTVGSELGKLAQFSPSYMADLDKMGKALLDRSNVPVLHHMGDNPALVTFPGRFDAMALLMPRRAELQEKSELNFLIAALTQKEKAAAA